MARALVKGYEYEKGRFVGAEKAYVLLREAMARDGTAKEPKLQAVEEPEQAEVVELMERLRASLQNAGGASKRKAARPKKASPRARRKRAA